MGGPNLDELLPVKGAVGFAIVAWFSMMSTGAIMKVFKTDTATYRFVVDVLFIVSLTGILLTNCLGIFLFLKGISFGGFVQSWLWLGISWLIYLKVLALPMLLTTSVEPLELRRDRAVQAPMPVDDRISDEPHGR
jgi:hypothetical protein